MTKYDCDVLFIVEHRSRELETYKKIAFLLAEEGLVSLIIQKFYGSYIIPFISPRVIISNGYGEKVLSSIIAKKLFIGNATFIIHHWEQLINANSEKLIFKNVNDFEQNSCVTLYWNEEFRNVLERKNFNLQNSYFVGNPNLSLLDDMNSNFSNLKDEMLNKYELKNKKVLFFPANFFWVFFHHRENTVHQFLHKWFKEQLSVTKQFIIDVLEKGDYVIIFRPHPYEVEKYYKDAFGMKIFSDKNFIYTDEYTVKEWTLLSNYVVSNFSTSAYDAFKYGKNACFLNEGGYLDFYNAEWLFEVPTISNYKDFEKFTKSENKIVFNDNNDYKKLFFNVLMNMNKQKTYYKVPFFKRIKAMLNKDVLKNFIRSVLCKYFKCYKINDTIKPDYFEPIIIQPTNK